ncbi:MAG: hypothetical protein CL609_04855 [Anaerolineaceae bacterium]|nr:hypothetical protein [Anaerolineaceae bacterium]
MGPTASSWFIGSFAILHFLIVSVAGLAPLTIYLMEGVALKKENPHLRRLAKQLITIVLELAAVGGILGSGVVVSLIGLRPAVITLIFNIFFWLIVLQLVSYIAGFAFQFAYYFTWDKNSPRHRLWGLLGAIFPLIPFIVFSAAIAFLSTPGSWPQTGNIWNAVFNPGMLVSLLHRMGAGISLLGVLIIVLHVFKQKKSQGEEKIYHTESVKFGTMLVIRSLEAQIVIGVVRTLLVPPDELTMLMGGPLTLIWVLGIVTGVLAWAALFYTSRQPKIPSGRLYLVAVILPVILTVGLMSVTRSKARGEFSIREVMTRTDTILALPARYQASDVPDGAKIYAESCGACHPGLVGDAPTLAQARHPDPADLAVFLRDPSAIKIPMPPYTGDQEELTALISFLLDIPLEDVNLDQPSAFLGLQ